jgi:hypothetical protein
LDEFVKKYTFILALICIGAFSFYLHQKKIYKVERDFAHFGLIRKSAIYTLLGDKPISDFGRVKPYTKPPENRYQEEGKTVVRVPSENLTFTKEDHFDIDLIDLWKAWKNRYSASNQRFALVCVGEESDSDLFLVNKVLVREVLEKHYDLFVHSLQMDFDIDQVIKKVDNPKSFFWTHMINCEYGHICMGLLFGYGLENTMEFEQCSIEDSFEEGYISEESDEEMMNRTYTTEVSLDHLALPTYRRFKRPDPVLEHYKKERARIQEEYKDADLRQLLIDALEK